jgi:hypothetical protein
MPQRRRSPRHAADSTALVGSLLCSILFASAAALAATDPADPVTLRGRVASVGTVDAEPDLCASVDARFELVTDSGERVRFLPEDPRSAIFTDRRVRERTLEIRGWRRPGGALEILSVHSIVGGRPHRIHYRCDVCNIDATAPGPCWCCGQDFELREEPVASTSSDSGPREDAHADADRHRR